jgi:membrane associated rhomboid family serine protease
MAFLQEPHQTHQPMFRIPFVVMATAVVLALAYLGWAFAPANIANLVLADFAFWPARYSAAYLAAHGAAQQSLFELAVPFIGYVFLHGDISHLVINCLWLLAFGPIVARRWGPGLFLAMFFICAVAAAFAHLATNWGSENPVIGASGAISGLMGAGIRMLRGRVWIEGEPFPRLASVFSSPVLVFTLFWLLANVLAGYTGIGMDAQIRLIAWQAHIGGFVAGLLLATPFDAFARRRLLNAR